VIGSTTLILVALTTTFAINISIINALQPTLTVLFAWLIFKEALSAWRILGITCGICGVMVMVSRADLAVLAGLDLRAGDFIALLAMCGFAGYALNLHRLPHEIGALAALLGITTMGTAILLATAFPGEKLQLYHVIGGLPAWSWSVAVEDWCNMQANQQSNSYPAHSTSET
jgi:drug/metabolite transporter (DMT)-like permease